MTTTYKVNNDNGDAMLLLEVASGKLDTDYKRHARRLSIGTHAEQEKEPTVYDGLESGPCVVCSAPTAIEGLKGDALRERAGFTVKEWDRDSDEALPYRVLAERSNIPLRKIGRNIVDGLQRLSTSIHGERLWLRIEGGEADRVLDDHTPLAHYMPSYERVKVVDGPGGTYSYATVANVCSICNGTIRNASMAPSERNDLRAFAGVVRAVSCMATVSEGGGLPDSATSVPTLSVTVVDRPSLDAFMSRVIPLYYGDIPPFVQSWIASPRSM